MLEFVGDERDEFHPARRRRDLDAKIALVCRAGGDQHPSGERRRHRLRRLDVDDHVRAMSATTRLTNVADRPSPSAIASLTRLSTARRWRRSDVIIARTSVLSSGVAGRAAVTGDGGR